MNIPKERPILFSAPMVRALLDGTKTQTRRIVKDQASAEKAISLRDAYNEELRYIGPGEGTPVYMLDAINLLVASCPYGQPGERLWVKETSMLFSNPAGIGYRADIDHCGQVPIKTMDGPVVRRTPHGKWKPSIFMRREFSRITLEIVSIRVERLQEISEEDALAEGVPWGHTGSKGMQSWSLDTGYVDTCKKAYKGLWESINGHGSWEDNPYVWVVELKRIKP